jgi:hypothetical protein
MAHKQEVSMSVCPEYISYIFPSVLVFHWFIRSLFVSHGRIRPKHWLFVPSVDYHFFL